MQVVNHLLRDDSGTVLGPGNSPNHGSVLSQPTLLVMHFTAGRSFESSVSWLSDPAAKASAHLVIGRDGRIAQLVAFNSVAWHAGQSSWMGRNGCNSFSIGIELDNAGELTRQGGEWRAWFGAVILAAEVMEAEHKHGGGVTGWHCYTEPQIEAAMKAGLAILGAYPSIADIVGHEDIAPHRKRDPGPAFPMGSFKARLLGRGGGEAAPAFRTTSTLNVRSGPGLNFAPVTGSPLPTGAAVDVDAESGVWRHVNAKLADGSSLVGWAHGGYLTS